MGIFDALTGDAGHAAAGNQRDVLAALIPSLASTGQDAYRNAAGALKGGFAGARTDLTGGQNTATGAINTGAGGALGYLDAGQQGAQRQLGQARTDLTANGGAFTPLSDLASRFRSGSSMYSDALGLNGSEGNARAAAAFTPSLSYNFNLDQGIDAINRKRNAAGMLNGGNADRDAQVFGAGLASNETKGWLDRLQGFQPLELSATSGAATGNAGINSTLANLGAVGATLANRGGEDKAGVSAAQGNSLADIANRYAMARAGVDTGEGSALANNSIGGAQNWQSVFGNAISPYNDTFKQDANASMAGSKNSLDLVQNLLKLGTGQAGSNSGSGNSSNGSSLSNLMGGNFFPTF